MYWTPCIPLVFFIPSYSVVVGWLEPECSDNIIIIMPLALEPISNEANGLVEASKRHEVQIQYFISCQLSSIWNNSHIWQSLCECLHCQYAFQKWFENGRRCALSASQSICIWMDSWRLKRRQKKVIKLSF